MIILIFTVGNILYTQKLIFINIKYLENKILECQLSKYLHEQILLKEKMVYKIIYREFQRRENICKLV